MADGKGNVVELLNVGSATRGESLAAHEGINVTTAKPKADISELLASNRFQHVVVDESFISGEEPISRSSTDVPDRVPVICAPNEGNERVASKALSMGVDKYIPSTVDDQVQKIANHVLNAGSDHRKDRLDESALLEGIQRVNPSSVVVVNEEWQVIWANERASSRLGIQDGDTYELGSADIFDEDGEFIPLEDRPYVEVFSSGKHVQDWECQIDLPRGRRWISISAAPLTPGESVDHVIITAEDITERKRYERRLRREREELAGELGGVLNRISDAFFALDEQWRFTYINDRATEILDVSESDVLGEVVWDEFEEAVDSPFEEQYRHAMEAQEPVSFVEYYAPLETWFEVQAYPSETGLSVYFRDVTERRERERRLNRQRQ
ncbi:MAG: PAS domain-containing protein, partial [Halobacteriaceae archaeon]